MIEVNKFDALKIGIASPEKIREWSYGEVKKPETINYRTLRPERDGLFCEKIFGPTKDWECHCGKYKRIRYKGVVCDRCGVEVAKAKVRRERMGHIELAAPVSHIWYFKGIPSRMGLVLNVSPKILEEVVYFVSWIVIDPGDTKMTYKQILSEREFRENTAIYGPGSFSAATGAEAVQTLLEQIDIETDGKNPQHMGVFRAWSGAILHGLPMVAEGVEGINGLTLSNAMHMSAFTGKPVDLPLDEEVYYEELMKRVATSRRKTNVREVVANAADTFSGSK